MLKNAYFILAFVCINSFTVFAQKPDTLYARKTLFVTHIFRDSVKLSKNKVMELFHDTWLPQKKYKWSNILKPVGPVVMLGGIGIAGIALRGANFLTTIDGRQISYRNISLPQLSVGVGLVVVGYSIIESSKLLAYNSVSVYNAMLKESRKTSYINKISFGITDNNSIGFSISLK